MIFSALKSVNNKDTLGAPYFWAAYAKTKYFEFSGSWVTERSDWLEYRFEFMIDRKNTSSVYLRSWDQLVLILEVAS